MTIFQPSDILNNVKNLVSQSCYNNSEPDVSFNSLHKGILKMYFEARDVEIDYQNKIIRAEIPVSTGYTKISIECIDLERFLKSCIKTDKKSILFYQNVLSYYGLLEVA